MFPVDYDLSDKKKRRGSHFCFLGLVGVSCDERGFDNLYIFNLYWYKCGEEIWCRLGCLRTLETVPSMVFYAFKAALEDTKITVTWRSWEEESPLFSHVLIFWLFILVYYIKFCHILEIYFKLLNAVVRGEKTRKEYTILLQRHRSAVIIQKQMKSRIERRKFKNIYDASVVIQSGILALFLSCN